MLNLSTVNAKQLEGSFNVIRKPIPLRVRIENNRARIENTSTGNESRIPLALFNSLFERWPNTKESEMIYFKKSPVLTAVRVSDSFEVVNFDFDDSVRKEVGASGDFLITRESGVNEICASSDFSKLFVDETLFFDSQESLELAL